MVETPLAVQGLTFSSGRDAKMDVVFRNSSNKEIKGFFSLFEFYGADHSFLLSIPVQTFRATPRILSEYKLLQDWADRLSAQTPEHDVLPGAFLSTGGISRNGLNGCPAAARLSIMWVQFADGATVEHHADRWQTDAALLETENSTFPSSVLQDAQFTLNVGADGRGRVLEATDEIGRNWLFRQLSHWEFIPAMINGNPIDSQLHLVVQSYPFRSPEQLVVFPSLTTFTALNVYPMKDKKGAEINYGGTVASQYTLQPQ